MKLYVYDHCPYCVRARMPFGLKGIDFQLEFFLNDDVDGPTALIGTKMVPILAKDDGTYMAESLDIVTFIDQNFGEPVLAPSANRPELTDWLANAALNPLTMPRWVQAPLAEFATAGGVAYFTEKKEQSIGPFAERLANSAELKEELNIKLVTLAAIIESPGAVNGTLSYDDILLFGHLRGITIVGGLEYPSKVRAYLDTLSEQSGVPLYGSMAID